MKRLFSIATFGLTGWMFFNSSAPINAAPVVEFETNTYNFGKITSDEAMTSVFKFKNTGDAELKVKEVLPSCDCTEAKAFPDTLAPGQSGEIRYSIKMDHPAQGERYITLHLNDPKKPSVRLSVQFDYTPLMEISPKDVKLSLPAGKDEAQTSFLVRRTDGKAINFDKVSSPEKWIDASIDPSYEAPTSTGFDVGIEPQKTAARVLVTMHRPALPPGIVKASVELWNSKTPDKPLRSVKVEGEVEAEVTASPSNFYWVLADFGKDIKDYPEQALTRHVELKSVLGKTVEIKNATSNVPGLTVSVVPKEPGHVFDLVLKFTALPPQLVNGKIFVETSLPTLPKLEVLLTIAAP